MSKWSKMPAGRTWLEAANPEYPSIYPRAESELHIFGIVIHAIYTGLTRSRRVRIDCRVISTLLIPYQRAKVELRTSLESMRGLKEANH